MEPASSPSGSSALGSSGKYRRRTSAKAMCKSTSRTTDSADIRDDRTSPPLNLTLYGSPAPRCLRRPTAPKPKKPVQPPNSPIEQIKLRKPPELPIDKILLLNERLNLTDNGKIKIELTSRQIKLSEDVEYSKVDKSARSDFCQFLPTPSSSSEEFEKLNGTSSQIDLSIDLSSVTNSDHETESSTEFTEHVECAEQNAPVLVPMVNKQDGQDSSSTWSQSPVPIPWNDPRRDADVGQISSATSYPYSRTTGHSFGSSITIWPDESQESSEREYEPRPQTEQAMANRWEVRPRARSADLIYVYVNTVSDGSTLSKYFRPCHSCHEPCCVCPDLVPDTSRTFSVQDGQNPSKPNPDVIAFEYATNQPEEPCAKNETRSNSSCSDFSNFLYERCFSKTENRSGKAKIGLSASTADVTFDSGTSTLQLDDINESDNFFQDKEISKPKTKKPMSLSMMQLATAAQCARILANSLESVLEMVEQETSSPSKDLLDKDGLIRFKEADLEDLFNTVSVLKSHFPQPSSAKNSQTTNWASFGDFPDSHVMTSTDNSINANLNKNTSSPFAREQCPEEKHRRFSPKKFESFSFEDNFEDSFLPKQLQTDLNTNAQQSDDCGEKFICCCKKNNSQERNDFQEAFQEDCFQDETNNFPEKYSQQSNNCREKSLNDGSRSSGESVERFEKSRNNQTTQDKFEYQFLEECSQSNDNGSLENDSRYDGNCESFLKDEPEDGNYDPRCSNSCNPNVQEICCQIRNQRDNFLKDHSQINNSFLVEHSQHNNGKNSFFNSESRQFR